MDYPPFFLPATPAYSPFHQPLALPAAHSISAFPARPPLTVVTQWLLRRTLGTSLPITSASASAAPDTCSRFPFALSGLPVLIDLPFVSVEVVSHLGFSSDALRGRRALLLTSPH